MSDDEEILLNKKIESLDHGTPAGDGVELTREQQERVRITALAASLVRTDGEGSSKESSQIHTYNEYMELEDEMSKDKQALLEEFERRRKARQINVSTDDTEVRKSLRQLGEPVCLFGEGPAERRARLRDLLSFLGEDAIHKRMEEEEARLEQERGSEATWYHEGPAELRDARLWIARYSLPRAKDRLRRAREEEEGSGKATTRAAVRQELQRRLGTTVVVASQVGGARPLTYCNFSDDSQMLATSSWSGLCNIWSVPGCESFHSLRGHNCQVGSIVFRPQTSIPPHFLNRDAEIDGKAKVCSLASCAYDGSVLLWNLVSEEPIGELSGHAPYRVSRVAFHPSGRFLGTCCRDSSWRLWDLEVCQELLHQEGHAMSPHCIAFQCDGSVAATGGLDSYGRIWDLRTGRCIMLMEGHQGNILDIEWSPTGYQLATAGGDNVARIWDLRRRASLYTIPAHTNLVSGIRYQRTNGHYLVSSSYDNTVKLWANITWQPLRTLIGHDSKVMGLDISPDDKYIATCSYDRTFKLWASEAV